MVLGDEPPPKIFAVGFLLLSLRIDKRDLLTPRSSECTSRRLQRRPFLCRPLRPRAHEAWRRGEGTRGGRGGGAGDAAEGEQRGAGGQHFGRDTGGVSGCSRCSTRKRRRRQGPRERASARADCQAARAVLSPPAAGRLAAAAAENRIAVGGHRGRRAVRSCAVRARAAAH